MRVLLVPHVYATSPHITGNSTVTDLAHWADAWLDQDPTIHIYWMLPPKDQVQYEDELFNLDHERVTAFVDRRFFQGTSYERIDEFREDQLTALADEKDDHHGYFDVVVAQHSESEAVLWQFLNTIYDYTYSDRRPFGLVKHIIDFNSDWKHHAKRYPNDSAVWGDLYGCTLADWIWSKSEWDTNEMLEQARPRLDYSVVEELQSKTTYVNSPIDFESFDGEFSDSPDTLHISGKPNIAKKHRPDAVEIGEVLYQRYDIDTVITSMETVEKKFEEKEFVTAYSECPYDRYVNMLQQADMVVCPTEYETGGKVWFEHVCNGQVFLAWDRPWLREYIPDDYKLLAGSRSKLKQLAVWAVENWDEAVAETQRMQDYLKETKNHEIGGHTTLGACHDHRDELYSEYELDWDEDVLTKALRYCGDHPSISELDEATAKFTDSGDPILSLFGYTLTDLIAAMYELGYVDTGEREPHFAPRDEIDTYDPAAHETIADVQ